MNIPKGFAKEGETRVRRLRKSLYGLKQASRNGYKKLTSFLFSLNFEQSKADYSLFTYQKAGPTTLTAYCDSDWLGCPFTRRSRIGYLLLFSGGHISWKTKKQSVVSRSSAEAEYKAMASTVSEILWVRWLLKDMQVQLTTPTSLFCDNQAARHIANNPVYHERTKHVEMDCFFVRERVETRDIEMKPIESKLQLADLLTKGLGTQQLRSLLNKMGIRDLHAPS
nr:putative reverse transcriptase, RNA-dependent DNA polymerase, Gag-polypeptide of LTR copia-type [Tanacetum cinerariifolium]